MRIAASSRGYSHVFVSGPSDSGECSDFADVAEARAFLPGSVLARAKLRELVVSWKDSNPFQFAKPWRAMTTRKEQIYRKPSDRVQIVQRRKSSDDESENGGGASGQPGKGRSQNPFRKFFHHHDASQLRLIQANHHPPHHHQSAVAVSINPFNSSPITRAEHKTMPPTRSKLKQIENLCKGALNFSFNPNC